jgi:CRISPR/Cas system endoribonuclease Cas6 (RAMP superfamily)
MAQRAAGIALVSQRITSHRRARTSSKTGQTHPLGGFTGEAVYEGDLDEFVPLLQAAHWTGIGRQTVWGKGVIEVLGACENKRAEPPPKP